MVKNASENADWHAPWAGRESFEALAPPGKLHVCLSAAGWHWQNGDLFVTFPGL